MMHIDDKAFPIQEDWSGELVPPQAVFSIPGGPLPRVSLGRPDWWSDEAIFADQWQVPDGGQRFGLARFSFSLRPEGQQSIEQADLIVRLLAHGGGRNPRAFDIFPRDVTAKRDHAVKIAVKPSLTFAEVTGSIGEVETTIDASTAVPVITADGVGEQTIRWVFQQQRTQPLVGSRVVYAIIEQPPDTTAVRVSINLMARVKPNLIASLMLGRLPEDEFDEEGRTYTLGVV
ncbi:MAG: hypothetical protein AAF629_09680 [Chloroflexota bacterium]